MEPDPSQRCTEKGQEDKRTSHKLQEEEFKVHIKETSLSESWGTGTGCMGWLQHPHPWMYAQTNPEPPKSLLKWTCSDRGLDWMAARGPFQDKFLIIISAVFISPSWSFALTPVSSTYVHFMYIFPLINFAKMQDTFLCFTNFDSQVIGFNRSCACLMISLVFPHILVWRTQNSGHERKNLLL